MQIGFIYCGQLGVINPLLINYLISKEKKKQLFKNKLYYLFLIFFYLKKKN